MGIRYPAKVISQQLSKPKINEVNLYSNKSFITKAVERTGAAVVTIDTQRYVKKRNFPRNSQLFLDPYFERFFGLDLPNEKSTKDRAKPRQWIFICRWTYNDQCSCCEWIR